MIDNAKIVASFRDLIGFNQRTGTTVPALNNNLLVSSSGKKVQLLHPILSLENLYGCWDKQGDFSTWLYNLRDNSIMNLTSALYNFKNINRVSKQLLSEVSMFEGSGNFNNKIVNQGRFCGLRVYTTEKDISLIINRIGLQFTDVNAEFPIYIYHSSQADPLATLTINQDKSNSFKWYNIDRQVLPFIEGGYYIIGYYEGDISGQAISRDVNLSVAPCNCDPVNYASWAKWSKFTRIQPIFIKNENINSDQTKWNDTYEVEYFNSNWGLNITLSAFCDPSDIFVRNNFLFVEALARQIVRDFATILKYSSSDNTVKERLATDSMFALYGDGNGTGAEKDYKEAIQALSFEISDINPVCLPCDNNAFRVRHTSVY